jgi:hypothetical protein
MSDKDLVEAFKSKGRTEADGRIVETFKCAKIKNPWGKLISYNDCL